MQTIIEAIRHTPWWVWIVFCYVLYMGIRGLKPRTIIPGKIFILPLIFSIWSTWQLIADFESAMDLLIWVLFIGLGIMAGWGFMHRLKLRADHKKQLIRIPGSPFTLVLVLIVFAVKYFFGYTKATSAELSPMIRSLDIVFAGLISGLFIGRTLAILAKIRKTKHEKLKKS